MCGYGTKSWERYQRLWTRDKLEAAEHTIENYEAELMRHRRFIAEKKLTVEWIAREISHA